MSSASAVATLRLVLGTAESTLETLRAAETLVDSEYVAELEKIVVRTRREIAALDGTARAADLVRDLKARLR